MSDGNHTRHMTVDHDRSVAFALDVALKDYRQHFGDERYAARLKAAQDAHAKAEAVRNG